MDKSGKNLVTIFKYNLDNSIGEAMKFNAVVKKDEKWFVAWCPELDIASQGKTTKEALANLQEAIELYLEDEDAKIPRTRVTFTEVEVNAKNKSAIST